MDWKSTRLWICLVGMGLTQWALVGRLIGEQSWMAVQTVCLAAFGITKTVEYARSGRVGSKVEGMKG